MRFSNCILARSGGNAFYAEELVGAEGPHARLPRSLRDVLLTRTATLGEPTQELLRTASAAGTRIQPELLVGVLGWSVPRFEGALRDAVAAQMLVPLEASAGGRFEFRHALLQETLYGDLLPGERNRLHMAFAKGLERIGATGDAAGAAELAYHRQAAHDVPGALDAWIVAGVEAERMYAYAQALADYEHALELWGQVPDAASRSPLDRVELLRRAALLSQGADPKRSVAYIRSAIELVDPVGDPILAGVLQERLGQYGQYVIALPEMYAAFEEAVRLVPAQPPSAARASVLTGLSRYYAMHRSEPGLAIALAEEALSVAQGVGARDAEAQAMLPLAVGLVRRGEVDAGLAKFELAKRLAIELGDTHTLAMSLTWLAASLHDAGRYLDAVAAASEAEGYAVRHGLASPWASTALFWMDEALMAMGRWDDAREALDRAERFELHAANQLILETKRLRLETLRGELRDAEQRVPRINELNETFAFELTGLVLADLALWKGDPMSARGAIQAGLDALDARPDGRVRREGRYLAVGIRAEADLSARAVSISGEEASLSRSIAMAHLERMRSLRKSVASSRPYYEPLATTIMAWCEGEFGRLVDAPVPDRWAKAGSGWQALGLPYERSYALMREAEATLATRRDRHRAAHSLAEAAAIVRRLEARPLLEAIEALADRARIPLTPEAAAVGSATAGAPAANAGPVGRAPTSRPNARQRHDLTPREREVVALLAAGRTDGEIAAALFISKKTASFHVATIKSKLGSRSRVEIATDAIGLGLAQAPVRET